MKLWEKLLQLYVAKYNAKIHLYWTERAFIPPGLEPSLNICLQKDAEELVQSSATVLFGGNTITIPLFLYFNSLFFLHRYSYFLPVFLSLLPSYFHFYIGHFHLLLLFFDPCNLANLRVYDCILFAFLFRFSHGHGSGTELLTQVLSNYESTPNSGIISSCITSTMLYH